MRRRILSVVASAVFAALAFTGCSSGEAVTPTPTNPSPAAGPTATPDPTPEEEPGLTGEMIAEWVADQEWLFSPDGLFDPFTLTLTGGTASDELMRTYELGDFVESDMNGDGVADIAISVFEHDGNGVLALWYVWLGIDGATDGEPLAQQMVYPVAKMTRCGDAVHEVSAIEGGLRINETLRHPLDPGDCATGGTWHQEREITVDEFDGNPYPILTHPIDAWGGICPVPTLDWLDGEGITGVVARSAPATSAPAVTTADETWGVFGLPEAPLMAPPGISFFGFMPQSYLEHSNEEIAAIPVRVHCAFTDLPESSQ